MEADTVKFDGTDSNMRIEHSGEIEWRTSKQPVFYPEAIQFMEKRVNQIYNKTGPETVWLLEHHPVYTSGTRSNKRDLLDTGKFPVYPTGRGGEYTYHGPGQRVAYVMLDLNKRGSDIRCYVQNLGNWVITALAHFSINGMLRDDRVGVWVTDQTDKEKKIAAIGVRVRRWVSYHGIAINIKPELKHFDGIVPCGISKYGVTSLHALGKEISLPEFDHALKKSFHTYF